LHCQPSVSTSAVPFSRGLFFSLQTLILVAELSHTLDFIKFYVNVTCQASTVSQVTFKLRL